MKKLLTLGVAILMMAAMSVPAFAASDYKTPAEAVAGVTGKDVQTVIDEARGGKSYGSIANDAGKLTEFHEALLEMRKDSLQASVDAGNITQARADEIIKALEDNQLLCDGTGTGGCGYGAGFGCGMYADGTGAGAGYGCGMNNGTGAGFGRGNGGGCGGGRFR